MKFYEVVLRNNKTYFVLEIGEFLKLYFLNIFAKKISNGE